MDLEGSQDIPSEQDYERDAAIAEEYLEGMPKINIGALLMPPIWGPAKGIWATILWYPLWIFADNCLFAWYSTGTVISTVFGILTILLLAAGTVIFAKLSAPYAAVRAVQKGKTKEEFQRGEFLWAIASAILAIIFIALATYYNLALRAPIAG